MPRLILRASYILAMVLTAFAIDAEPGWAELPEDVKADDAVGTELREKVGNPPRFQWSAGGTGLRGYTD